MGQASSTNLAAEKPVKRESKKVSSHTETVQSNAISEQQIVWYKDENGNLISFGHDTPADFPKWTRTGDLKTDQENYRLAKEQYKLEHQ